MISVIIPTFGGSPELKRAIQSVLNQTESCFEIIVVDDNNPGSEARSATQDLMGSFQNDPRIQYIQHQTNKNGAAARNTGIKASSGEYITFLDDDDYLKPERLEKSRLFLEEHPDCIGVYTGVKTINPDEGIQESSFPDKNLTVELLLMDELIMRTGSNIFLRKTAVDKVRGFDPSFIRKQDIEFMIRICHEGQIGYLPEILIIKSVNGIDNVPSYKKMMDTLSLLNSKFKSDIDGLNDPEDYYKEQRRFLFYTALHSGNQTDIKSAGKELKKYNEFTLKDRIRILLYKSPAVVHLIKKL